MSDERKIEDDEDYDEAAEAAWEEEQTRERWPWLFPKKVAEPDDVADEMLHTAEAETRADANSDEPSGQDLDRDAFKKPVGLDDDDDDDDDDRIRVPAKYQKAWKRSSQHFAERHYVIEMVRLPYDTD